MTIANNITRAERAYERWLTEAVAQVRKTYIIPYCNKHKLRFIAGNGEWYLLDHTGRGLVSWSHATSSLPPKMAKALQLGIYYGKQSLGSYAGEYTPPSML